MIIKLKKYRSKEVLYLREFKNNKTPLLTEYKSEAMRVYDRKLYIELGRIYEGSLEYIKLEEYEKWN